MINNVLVGWVLALATVVVWPTLLPIPFIIAAIPILLGLKRWPILLGIGLGMIYGQLACHYTSSSFQPSLNGEVEIIARLNASHSGAELYQRNQWLVESVSAQPLAWWKNNRIELGWYNPPPLRQGQRYRLVVKFRPPSGYLNLGGFNRYRHQLAKGIGASGYVKQGELLEDGHHWRHTVLNQLRGATESLQYGAVIRALVFADKSGISTDLWQQMRQAGLIHLLAISGLHLSIIAGGTLMLLTWLRQRLFANAYGRGRGTVWLITALVALGYGTMAQFGLPTMRATLAVLLALLLLWQKRQGRPWELLIRVAAVVLLVQPMASMAAGFWLSFGAVALILSSLWLWPTTGSKWLALVRIQLLLTAGMVPLQGIWFGEFSLHGIWTNLLLLPYFSLLVLPGCILLSVAYLAGAPASLLVGADWLLTPIIKVAELASSVPQGYGSMLPQSVAMLTVVLLAVGLLFWRKRTSAVTVLLAGFLWCYPPKPLWQLDLIDVGQGLAVLIQHQQQAMLVDTGAAFPSGFSYADAAIRPVLHRMGIDALEWLVVSHGDNDHGGGVNVIKSLVPVKHHIGTGGTPCNTAPRRWGQLQLQWFQAPLTGNDGSCVLLISSPRQRVLLPGDIEAAGEQAWLSQQIQPTVDLVIAPHHGSRTSSSDAFVRATSPKWVLFAAGRNNRWGFPDPQVVQRYEEVGAISAVSGSHGQIQMKLFANGEISQQRYRQHWAPWWYNQQ